jgi:penicillin-binding protein 2
VYFYKAGEATGIDGIAHMAREFGLGTAPGLGLVDEKRGLVPDTEWKKKKMNDNWYLGETYNAAIGQGYVLVTPAQQARMAAAVSSGVYPEELSLTRVDGGAHVRPLEVDPEDLAFVKESLLGVVNEGGGTGGRARSQVVKIGGKTGTAQVVSQKGGKESNEERFQDHAWFVAFAPEGAAEVAMAVLVEHGGHGGSAAAPVAKAAIEAYMNTFPKPAPPAEGGEATPAPEGAL